ncbi:hypothetical protein Hypma_013106 [Hypsizygus marmoreus]|uniref:Uncharacterized protein n=1 Tax=Hypsizygus marmoreus TaxID=39966 RepID=A0A369JFG9_HYPMA|nr:hypothetical protein Hypma_013106 [Hypsizygus marmoreus]
MTAMQSTRPSPSSTNANESHYIYLCNALWHAHQPPPRQTLASTAIVVGQVDSDDVIQAMGSELVLLQPKMEGREADDIEESFWAEHSPQLERTL